MFAAVRSSTARRSAMRAFSTAKNPSVREEPLIVMLFLHTLPRWGGEPHTPFGLRNHYTAVSTLVAMCIIHHVPNPGFVCCLLSTKCCGSSGSIFHSLSIRHDVHRECVKAGITRTAVVAVQGRPLLSASELTSGEWGGWTLLLEAVCSRDMTCERLPVAGGLVSIVRRPDS